MESDETTAHLKAVRDALPPEIQERCKISYRTLAVIGEIDVSIDSAWSSNPKLRLNLNYKFNGVKGHPEIKNRVWKRRQRDRKFCYDRIAGHLVIAVEAFDALERRRSHGNSLALIRGTRLRATFDQDPLLSSLNLNVKAKPTRRTETGKVDITFGPKEGGRTSTLQFDGHKFTGLVNVGEISAEQVTALMAVIRLKHLNLLDLITLADDSILGPSIQRMTADMDSNRNEEKA